MECLRVKLVIKHPDAFIIRLDQCPEAIVQRQRAMADLFQNGLEEDHWRVEEG